MAVRTIFIVIAASACIDRMAYFCTVGSNHGSSECMPGCGNRCVLIDVTTDALMQGITIFCTGSLMNCILEGVDMIA